jgi:hypothetical protein
MVVVEVKGRHINNVGGKRREVLNSMDVRESGSVVGGRVLSPESCNSRHRGPAKTRVPD